MRIRLHSISVFHPVPPFSEKGIKSVPNTTTGHEKDRFTVMLFCTADGGKLLLYVIFKRKTIRKGEYPAGVIVRAQQTG